jgi:hypothetical protein
VAAVGRCETELGEDVADVLLRGVAADVEALGDRVVVVPLGHQREHLTLARGERGHRAAAGQQLGDHLRVERGAAPRHAGQRVDELVHPAHPVLPQVAGATGRPLPCGGVYWGHPGGGAGYATDNAVTGDGRRSVALSVNGMLGNAPDDFIRQQHAADVLVEGALCGEGATRPPRG